MIKLTTLEERFLTSYFQIEMLVGKFISDEENDRLFASLADIFLIASERRAELSALKELGAVKSIGSNYEYNLHRRIVTFNRLTNYQSYSEDELYVCDIKGRSATMLEELGFNFVLDTTSPAVVRFLTNTAGQGVVLSMRILGTLQALGIFVTRNERAGLKLLTKASKWNDPDAMLTLLCHDIESRENSISMLRSVSEGTPFETIYSVAKSHYGFGEVERHFETELVMSALALHNKSLRPEIYSPQIARIAYSEVLTPVDKKRLVLNNIELVGEANSLPIGLKRYELSLSESPAPIVLERQSEANDIIQGVMYSAQTDNSLSPCIVANDDFVAGQCQSLIANAFPDANVVSIDVQELYGNDLNSDKNNIIVRSLSESKRNILLLVMRGRADARIIEVVSKFLRAPERREFRLSVPSVTLDLSSVVTVCITDAQNHKLVKPFCDNIEVANMTREEKESAIYKILAERARAYGIEGLEITPEAKDALLNRIDSFTMTESILDRLAYSCKSRNGERVIDLERASKLIESRAGKLGF